MKMMKQIAILTALLLSGCAHYDTHTGDFANFLLPALESRGATLPAEVPAVDGLPTTWRAKPDRYGIIIHAPRESFPEIDLFLRGIFGEPQIWTDRNLDGHPQGVFSPEAAGCVIQYLDSEEEVEIIILKKREKAEPSAAPLPSEGAPSEGR